MNKNSCERIFEHSEMMGCLKHNPCLYTHTGASREPFLPSILCALGQWLVLIRACAWTLNTGLPRTASKACPAWSIYCTWNCTVCTVDNASSSYATPACNKWHQGSSQWQVLRHALLQQPLHTKVILTKGKHFNDQSCLSSQKYHMRLLFRFQLKGHCNTFEYCKEMFAICRQCCHKNANQILCHCM